MTTEQRTPGESAEGAEDEHERALPAAPAPLVVPQGVQLVLLLVALLGLWVAARAAREVVLVFTIASLIALLLNPFVERLRRYGLPRGLAIPLTYISLFVALFIVGYALAQPITNQVTAFEHNVPKIVDEANKQLANVQTFFNHHGIHVKLRKQGQTALQTLKDKIVKGSSSLLSFTTRILTTGANAAIALVLIFVVSVYLLIYARQIGTLARRWLPAGDGTPQDDYPTRLQHAVSSYVRGQLIFSVAMGTGAGLALWIYGLLGIFPDGRTYAFAFGTFFGVMELVPYIGPILGAIPAVLLALFENPVSALWVVILFVGIQQLEGHVVAPQIFSHALRINPLLVILALLFGDAIYGIVGALVALPVAAVLRETILYLRRHVVLEPWHVPYRGSG
ncbi:MAG: AI-2E family transporter [Solirubrobacteraceae bacterium]|jgi:predicted PurR-regulated permease PerM